MSAELLRIYLVTDIEGVAGVLDFDNWCTPDGYRNEAGCRLLTAETNAAVRGFFDGGAQEVVVLDGHGSGGSIRGEMLDPRALLQRGVAPDWPTIGRYDAIAMVGQHPKSGTPGAHLSHTQMFDAIDFRINGLSVGEYGQLALTAAEEGVPTIFVSGCEAMKREAAALTPQAIAVAVKRGLNPAAPPSATAPQVKDSQLSAIHLSPERAAAAIYQGALTAIQKLRRSPQAFTLPPLQAPFVAEAEYRANDAMTASWAGELPPRRIRTREHATITEAIREFYREIEWIQPDGNRVIAL